MRYSETITIEDLDTDPFPHYARLRATDPIAPVPAANCWFATRWADVELIARHPDFTAVSDEAPVNAAFGRPNVLTSEGPTHAALRGGIEPHYRPRRRFAVLLNRFRWEDREAATREKRPYERVQALLAVENVTAVRTQGIDRGQGDTILSLLDLRYDGPAEGPGTITLTLAGDGAIELAVEALEISLRDTTRPYRAVSGKAPTHD